MIKRLPSETIKYLSYFYDRIWEDIIILNKQKSDALTLLLKERKDTKYVRSYKPITLGNILCKIVERITNKRFVWYFKNEKKTQTVWL